VEQDTIPGETLAQIEEIGSADVVVGVLRSDPDGGGPGAARLVRDAVGSLSRSARAVVIHNNGTAEAGATSSAPEVEDEGLRVLSCNLSGPGPSDMPQPYRTDAYRLIFAASGRLEAQACGVIASDLRGVTPQWIYRLVQPTLEEDFDFVAPVYAGHKFEGLINKSIIAPLHQALYGLRIQNPMGPDLAVSGKLLQQVLARDSQTRNGQPAHPASIGAIAAAGGFRICEANLGVRLQPAADLMNLSSLLAQVIGPVYQEMERNAAAWQRNRGSQLVPRFGDPAPAPPESGSTDIRRMVESFQLGAQNLQDIWRLVLPPKAMLEIVRLARLPAATFRMPDELWVSIIYDFALGYRLRTINRDHLLRSLTPLYLGWVASYAFELETAGPSAGEERLERLAKAYEAGKPYLVSRWRWPDRFNP
jgi:hypothetical protein